MADIFNFFVYDDRSIQFEIAEPIMLEDTNVTEFKFRIPKSINGFDMTGWAWWFVYVNASRQKYSVPLSFTDDEDEPEEYANATYTVNYGLSGVSGTVQFALEAINANGLGEIQNEWHTRTYSTKVIETLQGNQVEYAETESDIISTLIVQVQRLIEQGGGLDATGVTSGYVPTADGNGGWRWQAQQGGGGSASTSDDVTNESTVTGETVTDALNALSGEIATKGTYSKPSGGIPKTDLASAVQTSLGKADTALQTAPVTSINGKTGAVVIGNATTSAQDL